MDDGTDAAALISGRLPTGRHFFELLVKILGGLGSGGRPLAMCSVSSQAAVLLSELCVDGLDQ